MDGHGWKHVCLCISVCVKGNVPLPVSGLWNIHLRLFPLQSASGHTEETTYSRKEWDQCTRGPKLREKTWWYSFRQGMELCPNPTSKWVEATNSLEPTWICFLILKSIWLLTSVKRLYISTFFASSITSPTPPSKAVSIISFFPFAITDTWGVYLEEPRSPSLLVDGLRLELSLNDSEQGHSQIPIIFLCVPVIKHCL